MQRGLISSSRIRFICSLVEEIEKNESCVETLENREVNKKHRGKGLVGDTYFAGRRPEEDD